MKKFLIIDDDAVNNLICSKYLNLVFPGCETREFMRPSDALAYLGSLAEPATGETGVTVFLDIDMPEMNGWAVLEQLMKLPETVRAGLKIYILTSSVDVLDKQRARHHSAVIAFVEKPLSVPKLQRLLGVQ